MVIHRRPCGLLTPVCLFSSAQLLMLVLTACADDPTADSISSTTASTTATSSSTPSSSTSSDATDAAATSEPTPTTGDPSPALAVARGIRLTRVTATQGVQTELVRDGLELPASDLTVALISRRKTVLRADWSLHADFTPRELIGRLTVWTPENDPHVDEFKVMVDGPSNDGDLFKTFAWQLPAELVRPGLEYRIEAFEVDPAQATGEVSDPPPILPLPGRGTLVVEDAPMVIKVVLIPVKHVFAGDTCMPAIGDADVEAMKLWIEQHNPVEYAELSVGEPFEYTASIGGSEDGFVPILTELSMRRTADAPADNVYYYGLLTSCDEYPTGLGGQAFGIPDAPLPGLAYQRVAVGRYSGSGAAARDTFVHEVGHSQGRFHIRCSGGEAGVDPDYPHPNGRIGVWGYGIHDTFLRSPIGYRDYMSYCNVSFVSDYGWALTHATIRELSSWDSGAAPAEQQPLLVGTVYDDGRSTWWTTRGSVPRSGRDPATQVEFIRDGETLTAPASLGEIPDARAKVVAAALPSQWSSVSAVQLRVAGQLRAAAPRSAIR